MKIKDSYTAHLATLSFHPKYQTTLGFISGDTLYAGYDYSYRELIQATIGQILITFMITALLIICIINLCRTIRDEKKSGEYRELFISNLVHDLKRPIEDVIKVLYLLRDLPPEEQTSRILIFRKCWKHCNKKTTGVQINYSTYKSIFNQMTR